MIKHRTPAAPGPGPISPGALRRLDLPLRRRIAGRASGERRAALLGDGAELAQVRPYVAGDDVRRVDPNAFARTFEPHVRVYVADRAATTWLVLDASASMAFGTADRRKCDVAEGLTIAVAHVACRQGGRLGVMRIGGAGAPVVFPPRQGRGGVLGAMRAVYDDPPPEGSVAGLGDALRRLRGLARTRGAVVVVSDLRGPLDWEAPLGALSARHGTVVLEVRDPREDALEPVGEVWMTDPETGAVLRVNTSSRKLRERFAAVAAAERAEVAAAVRRAGAAHAVLSTRGDWLRALARGFDAERRAARSHP